MSVAINAANFPDEQFREYIRANIAGGSSILTDSDIEACIQLKLLSQLEISDLKGLEYLTELRYLTIGKNKGIKAIDVSGLTKLKQIAIGGTGISEIDLSKNVNLDYCSLDNNKLFELDLSKNIQLTTMDNPVSYIQGTVFAETGDPEHPIAIDVSQYLKDKSRLQRVKQCGVGYESSTGSIYGAYEDGILKVSKAYVQQVLSKHAGDNENVLVSYEYEVPIHSACPLALSGGNHFLRVWLYLDPFIITQELPDLKIGEQYSAAIEVMKQDGAVQFRGLNPIPTEPLKFEVTNGTLPPGLSLDAATGIISGS